jgi:hypothetical protein
VLLTPTQMFKCCYGRATNALLSTSPALIFNLIAAAAAARTGNFSSGDMRSRPGADVRCQVSNRLRSHPEMRTQQRASPHVVVSIQDASLALSLAGSPFTHA